MLELIAVFANAESTAEAKKTASEKVKTAILHVKSLTDAAKEETKVAPKIQSEAQETAPINYLDKSKWAQYLTTSRLKAAPFTGLAEDFENWCLLAFDEMIVEGVPERLIAAYIQDRTSNSTVRAAWNRCSSVAPLLDRINETIALIRSDKDTLRPGRQATDEDITSFIQRTRRTHNSLADGEILEIIVKNLNQGHKDVLMATGRKPETTDQLKTIFRVFSSFSPSSSAISVLPITPTCKFCGKRGHLIETCWSMEKASACEVCGKSNHSADRCFSNPGSDSYRGSSFSQGRRSRPRAFGGGFRGRGRAQQRGGGAMKSSFRGKFGKNQLSSEEEITKPELEKKKNNKH